MIDEGGFHPGVGAISAGQLAAAIKGDFGGVEQQTVAARLAALKTDRALRQIDRPGQIGDVAVSDAVEGVAVSRFAVRAVPGKAEGTGVAVLQEQQAGKGSGARSVEGRGRIVDNYLADV